MSTEIWLADQWKRALGNPDFRDRIADLLVEPDDIIVTSDSHPIGEALARVYGPVVVAVAEEDAPDGFRFFRVAAAERVIDDISREYWDNKIGPGLLGSGVPRDEVGRQRRKYVQNVHANPAAQEQLRRYAADNGIEAPPEPDGDGHPDAWGMR